jgi:hypothetical protein
MRSLCHFAGRDSLEALLRPQWTEKGLIPYWTLYLPGSALLSFNHVAPALLALAGRSLEALALAGF